MPPLKRRQITPLTALDMTLRVLGSNAPSVDEISAIRALTRGHASGGQQRTAIRYIMGQLCNVGGVSFTGEQSHTAAFRSGAQAVGVAIAQIGDAVLMRFPTEEEKGETNEQE